MNPTATNDGPSPVYNRFDLVLLAAQRGREIAGGSPPTLDRDGDKNAVLALREISQQTVSIDALQEALIHNFQQHLAGDEPDEDFIGDQFVELMVEDQLLAGEAEKLLGGEGFSIEEELDGDLDLEDEEEDELFEDLTEESSEED